MTPNDRQLESALVRSPVGTFSEQELDGLPEPVKRFFRATIRPGSPLAQSARIDMKGRIKVRRWLPFSAHELLTPHVGFVWTARAGGLISGSDRFVDGEGEMSWKLGGLIPVMRAAGPDVSRSTAERAAAEAVWVPTALLPRFGVEWAAVDENHISACYQIATYPIRVRYTLAGDGLVRSLVFDRWGDPDVAGTFGLFPFGGEFTAHRTFREVTIPVAGRFGWHHGTDRWTQGEFFRYRITDLALVTRRREALERRPEDS